MRGPSGKVLINRCDIYVAPPGRDTDAAVQFPYPPTPTFKGVLCTAQPTVYYEDDGIGRITQFIEWRLMFNMAVSVNPRDKIVIYDSQGNQHITFVDATRDEAGRGAAFSVRAKERS